MTDTQTQDSNHSVELATAVAAIRHALPAGAVWDNLEWTRPTGHGPADVPTVVVRANYAVGAALFVQVARILGGPVPGMGRGSGYGEALTALAAGLPVPEDDAYAEHRFEGAPAILVLAAVLQSWAVEVYERRLSNGGVTLSLAGARVYRVAR